MQITAPTKCPDCDSVIAVFTEPKSEITTHWCENVKCKGRIADMLTFVAGRTTLEIEGLGPEMAAILAEKQLVVTLADLFEFSNDAYAAFDRVGAEAFSANMNKRGIPGAAAIKMIKTVERAKRATWDRWIASLGIPMIGHTLGKVLAKEASLDSNAMELLPFHLAKAVLKDIEGIGLHKKEEINVHAADRNFAILCQRLHAAGVRPTALDKPVVAEGSPLAAMVFCITGEFLETIGSREYITQELTKLGATAKSGVSKKLTHLLVGTEAGSTKLAKAAALPAIQQMGEDALVELLTKHGVKVNGYELNVDWAD